MDCFSEFELDIASEAFISFFGYLGSDVCKSGVCKRLPACGERMDDARVELLLKRALPVQVSDGFSPQCTLLSNKCGGNPVDNILSITFKSASLT